MQDIAESLSKYSTSIGRSRRGRGGCTKNKNTRRFEQDFVTFAISFVSYNTPFRVTRSVTSLTLSLFSLVTGFIVIESKSCEYINFRRDLISKVKVVAFA